MPEICRNGNKSTFRQKIGNYVATVEHGVPLMRSKWVHRTWAHQEGTQGQGTRLADGPPICPTATRQGRHRQPRLRAGEPSGVTPNPSDDTEVPGTRTLDRRPGSPLGSSLCTSEEDKFAISGWKLLEDLGAKKMEAPKGGKGGKAVSLYPPSLEKVGGHTYPLSEEYLDEKRPRRLLGRTQRGFPAKTTPAPRAHLWYPLGL